MSLDGTTEKPSLFSVPMRRQLKRQLAMHVQLLLQVKSLTVPQSTENENSINMIQVGMYVCMYDTIGRTYTVCLVGNVYGRAVAVLIYVQLSMHVVCLCKQRLCWYVCV